MQRRVTGAHRLVPKCFIELFRIRSAQRYVSSCWVCSWDLGDTSILPLDQQIWVNDDTSV